MLFQKKRPLAPARPQEGDFAYLAPGSVYLDSACQTLRPQPVIDAEVRYYREYNACGGRVKYRWGQAVDAEVAAARALLLELCGKSAKDYCVAFTPNTTAGINLVLHQLPDGAWDRIVTTEIEHNSVHLPSITWAKRRGARRLVLPRDGNGDLRYAQGDLAGAVTVLNSLSNIDGRRAGNLRAVAKDAHASGGILLVDAAQGFSHSPDHLRDVDFDAAFGSAHKMYGPSLGFIVIKRSLLDRLDPFFIGGGTVSDTDRDGYTLLRNREEAHAVLEPGLQNWGGIIGLAEAVRWLGRQDRSREASMAASLYEGLRALPRIRLLASAPSPIQSFHAEGLDAHQLALYLSGRGVMCRSGHFCCHSYLQHQLGLPPLLRVSLGLHNTPEDVGIFLDSLRKILTAL